jgi:hypothetical protein
MHDRPSLDLSVVIPFQDDEDVIGAACHRLSRHLRELEVAFEIIAVDEHSTDNSPTILSLLRQAVPELRIAWAASPGRGFEAGCGQARGRVVLLIQPRSAMATLAPVGRAFRRVFRGELDLAVVEGRFAIAHRTNCLPVLRSQKVLPFRRLARRVRMRGLGVETYELGSNTATLASVAEGRLARWLGALAPARLAR